MFLNVSGEFCRSVFCGRELRVFEREHVFCRSKEIPSGHKFIVFLNASMYFVEAKRSRAVTSL